MPTASPLILLIDDELAIRRFLVKSLTAKDYRLLEAETGAQAIRLATQQPPDLVILDLGLPDIDGQEVLKQLRQWLRAPIIVLSARDQESQKIAALDSGADDYLTKPFSGGELLARLRVMLRRGHPGEDLKAVRFGTIEVDLVRRVVTRAGQEVHLTAREHALLRLLAVNAGKVITHRQILRELWGPNAEQQTQYLRVYMGRLRQKLEDNPNQPKHLKTESGIGYRLVIE